MFTGRAALALLFILGTQLAACGGDGGDAGTQPQTPQYADFAGTWRLTPNTSAANYKNCNNLNVNSGGVHFVLPPTGSLGALNGTHDAGYGAGQYRATLGGSITPPTGGTLRFVRPGGEGRLTISSVTPTRIEGQFLSTDQSFADPSFGRTPCAFDAVATKQ